MMKNTEQKQQSSMSFLYSILTSDSNQAKTLGLVDGRLVKSSLANPTKGKFSAHKADTLAEFASALNKFTVKQSLIIGAVIRKDGTPLAVGEKINLALKGKESDNAVSRSKDFIKNIHQAGFMLFDIDGNGASYQDVQTFIPELAGVGAVVKPSSSSLIYDANGTELVGDKGRHIFVPINDMAGVDRIAAIFWGRQWLAGHGHYLISNGVTPMLLERGIYDQSVLGRSERLAFEAKPILNDGLVQRNNHAVVIEGGVLDTSTIPDLTESELAKIAELKTAAKQRVRPEHEKVVAVKKAAYIATGKSEADWDGLQRRELPRDFAVSTAQGIFKVGDMNHAHDRVTLRDPFDPDYDGGSLTKAKFYWNNGTPKINSQAHGGIVYTIEKQPIEITANDAQALLKQAVSMQLWWQPEDLIIETQDTVIITQRIADAQALTKSGHKAVAIIDLNAFPLTSFSAHCGKAVQWLIGYDRDKATLPFIQGHRKLLTEQNEKAALITLSEDSVKNDWATHKKLDEKSLEKYKNLGGIVGANSKEEVCFYTFCLHNQKIRHCVIDYKNSTYSCDIDADSYNGVPELTAFLPIAKITRILETKLNYLYHQEPENGEDGRYVFRVDFANFAPSKELVVTHSAFSSGAKFKEAALKVAGNMFKGESRDVEFMYGKWMANWKKTVKTLDYVGYDKSVKAYIFNDYAFQNNKIIPLNTEGYFSLPSGHSVKTLMDAGQVINPAKPINWFNDYHLAYDKIGLINLAWHLGSLFAEQISEKHSSFPFFELSDSEGGTGKSHMVEVMSKLMGRDYTPFNPMTSRPAARMRRTADSCNLPLYCNEAENEDSRPHSAGFSWNEWKDGFERKGVRSIGVKTNDNHTKTPPFRVTLMIIQNVPVHADVPFLQRIVHQTATRKHHTIEGRHADMRLMQANKADLSGWLVHVLTQETNLLSRFFSRYAVHNDYLQRNPKLKSQRIMHNHSQLMALIDCLDLVTPIGSQAQTDMLSYVEKMAEEREQALQKDHPLVQQFWDNYHYLSSVIEITDPEGFPIIDPLNHSNDKDHEIAVNLNDFRRWSFEKRQEMPDEKELKRHLVTGISHKFIESNRPITSRITKKSVRVWVFKKGAS